MIDNSAVEPHGWWGNGSGSSGDVGDHTYSIDIKSSIPQLDTVVTIKTENEELIATLSEVIDALPENIKKNMIKRIKAKKLLELY